MIIPTVGARAVHDRIRFSAGFDEITLSDSYGMALFGVGVIINQRYGLAPMFLVPFEALDSGTQFALTFTIHY